jgi:hypothetical protein
MSDPVIPQAIKVEFQQVEIDVLIQFLDLAVKSQGLRVAGDALVLTRKLQGAVEQAKIEAQANALAAPASTGPAPTQ